MGVHDGHRGRMKKRFVRYGLDNFDDISVLELLLFYAIPQGDVNPLAHALLAEFGSTGNTLREASRAGRHFAEGLAELIEGLS